MYNTLRYFAIFLLILFGALIAFFAFAPRMVQEARNPVAGHDSYDVSEAAYALHQDLVIGDWHADPLLWRRDLTMRSDVGQVDIPRLIEGNVALQVFTAVTKSPAGQNINSNATDTRDNITLLAMGQRWPFPTWSSLTERALYQARKLQRFEDKSNGDLKIIRTRADLEALLEARSAGAQTVGAILGIEGAHALEGDLANLDRLETEGIRLIGFHHFFDNELGGSLHGTSNQGLSDLGRALVAEVDARGMILDVAHSSVRAVEDILSLTNGPVVLSHGGIKSYCDTARNLPDDVMRRIAEGGGVLGFGFWVSASCDISPAGLAAGIKVAIDVMGEDHVSLGSDFDGSVMTAFDVAELPALTQALLDVGLSEAQIRKVMGQNMLRVLRARLN